MSPVFKSSHQRAPTAGWSLGDAQPKAEQQNTRAVFIVRTFICSSAGLTLLLLDVILKMKSLERVYCSRTPLTTSRFFSLCPVLQNSKSENQTFIGLGADVGNDTARPGQYSRKNTERTHDKYEIGASVCVCVRPLSLTLRCS